MNVFGIADNPPILTETIKALGEMGIVFVPLKEVNTDLLDLINAERE